MDQHRSFASADHVIGIFARERLSGALSAVHRSGFGQHVRVFDGSRLPISDQLLRAGLRLADVSGIEQDALMVVVTAPGRTTIVAELFHQLSAERVLLAERASSTKATDPPPTVVPRFERSVNAVEGA